MELAERRGKGGRDRQYKYSASLYDSVRKQGRECMMGREAQRERNRERLERKRERDKETMRERDRVSEREKRGVYTGAPS